jgi:hypothetical protein
MTGGRQFRRDAFSLWLEAPLVIAMRCHEVGMAALTGSTQNTAEMTRMVTERWLPRRKASWRPILLLQRP